MENSPQNPSPQSIRRIGPNITKVLIAGIWAGAVVVSFAILAFALQPQSVPTLMTAVTPVVEWGREMASNAFYMAIGAGGGGVGGVAWKSRKNAASGRV